MRNPRTHLFLLTAIIVGLVGRAWLPEVANPARRASRKMPGNIVYFESAPSVEAKPSDTPAEPPTPVANVPVTQPLELSAEGNQLVAEMCELQLMAEGTDLALDSSQWSALATVVLRAQAARHAFEAQIATAKMIAPRKYRLEIPAYADAGDALREEFASELSAELGEPVATDVLVKLGGRLEGRFAGFGVGMQTLDITATSGGKPGDVQLTRTVEFWNSVEGGDRLTTRRETFFPILEDPTGDTWSALLALVNVVGTENGPG